MLAAILVLALFSIGPVADALDVDPIDREPFERLAHDGELFFRLRDYARASIIFSDIVENYPDHRSLPDALFLLGESLFSAGDYFGARTRFRAIIERADEPAFRSYVQRALGRLIEIAIHTRNFEGVESYFARLSRLAPSEIEAATQYSRAKYLYNAAVPVDDVMVLSDAERTASSGRSSDGTTQPIRIDAAGLDRARLAFESIDERSTYFAQARYFVGVIHTLQGRFPEAIEAFRRVLRSPAPPSAGSERDQVVDLTQLALGRLYYETDQLEQAIAAYQSVQRTSALFDVALYEAAWVYLRQGDSTRAEQALELLTVAAPESRLIPNARVLRGNLLLRGGRFDAANQAFVEVHDQFAPVRTELDQMIAGHPDPGVFFRDLVRQNLEAFDASQFLPPLAVRWTRTEGEMERALSALSDLSQCRALVRETTDLIERMSSALSGDNRVSAFPDLRHQREESIALRNRVSRLRTRLVNLESGTASSPELRDVRSQRRAIEEQLGRLPTTDDDFALRNDRALERYRLLERQLRELEVTLLGMEAQITAMSHFRESARAAAASEPQDAVGSELAAHHGALAEYRRQIDETRLLVERARVQVGVGDTTYARDDQLRREYTNLVERERALVAAGGGRMDPELERLFERITRIESQLDSKDSEVDAVVEERTREMKRAIDHEIANVEGYRSQLAVLEQDGVDVVGGITRLNFEDVRRTFYDLVLRADVGRVDVSWAVREEHRGRVEMLTRERQREIQVLDDEFRDILQDDVAGSGPSAADTGAATEGAPSAQASPPPDAPLTAGGG